MSFRHWFQGLQDAYLAKKFQFTGKNMDNLSSFVLKSEQVFQLYWSALKKDSNKGDAK